MNDRRIGPGLVNDVLDVLRGYGFARGDDEHVGRAILRIGDLARTYEGTQDHPFGPSINPAPAPQIASEPPGPDSRDPVILPASDRKNLLIALDIAADYQRCRAALCTGCSDRTCPSCQGRLRDAHAYDQLADRIFHTTEAAPAVHPSQAGPPRPARQSGPAADKEAGQ